MIIMPFQTKIMPFHEYILLFSQNYAVSITTFTVNIINNITSKQLLGHQN